MKKRANAAAVAALILATMALPHPGQGMEQKTTIKTLDGKTYPDVRISRVEPDGLVLETDAGVEKIFFRQLPAEVQKRYGYEPGQAAQFAAAVQSAQAANARALGESAAREEEERQRRNAEIERATAQTAAMQQKPAAPRQSDVTKLKPLGHNSSLTGAAKMDGAGGETILNQQHAKRYSIRGKVLQAFSDGILVESEKVMRVAGPKAVEGLVLVRGAFANPETNVRLQGEFDGYYDYTTVLGGQRRVEAYRMVK